MERNSVARWSAAGAGRRLTATLRLAAGLAAICVLPQQAIAEAAPAGVAEALQRIAVIAASPVQKRAAHALWGRQLDAPTIFRDRSTGMSWRSDPATGAPLAVVLRKDQPPANTCIDVEGAPHVTLLLPLPTDSSALAALYWHEQWHCIQTGLGLPASEGNTAHLDSETGRTWLRLEMRALARALATRDDAQARKHVAAALRFRALRGGAGAPGTDALAEEAKLERNEGLAEYTGRSVAAAAAQADGVAAVVEALAKAESSESFVRSAAYATGPAYGMLLDRWSPGWRSALSAGTSLPALLADRIRISPANIDVARVGQRYGMDQVRTEERARAEERERRSAALRVRLLGEDAVRFPLKQPALSFDPRSLFPLDSVGTVYTPVTVRDEWGELTADSGGLLLPDWSQISVGGGAIQGCNASWTGPGWKLELEPGWRFSRHPSGWQLTKEDPLPCSK